MSHTEMYSSAEIHLMLKAGIDSNAEMNSILNGEVNWNAETNLNAGRTHAMKFECWPFYTCTVCARRACTMKLSRLREGRVLLGKTVNKTPVCLLCLRGEDDDLVPPLLGSNWWKAI